MNGKFYLPLICITATMFFCCHHSNKDSVGLTAPNAQQINSSLKAKEKNTFALLSDSVKLPSSAKTSSPRFSVTRFYYDSATKELFRAENIFPATGRQVFVAYFDKGRVVKTLARTEFGWYDYYFSPEEDNATNNDSGKAESSRRSRLRQQCLELANEQLAVFQRKIK